VNGQQSAPGPQERTRRPWGVTLLALGVLCIAAFNLLGFYQVLMTRELTKSILPFSPTLLGIGKLIFGIGGVFITWSLWTGRPWAPKLTRLACLVYAGYLWIDRLLLQNPVGNMENKAFMAVATLISILLVFWLLAKRGVQNYFGSGA
jgi:hypothetical protein